MTSFVLKLVIFTTLYAHKPVNAQSFKWHDEETNSLTETICLLHLSPQAQYPGGAKAWHDFLRSNAQFSKTPGDPTAPIFLAFSVSKEGVIENIKIIRGKNSGHNKEAVRLLKLSSPWQPAVRNGVPEISRMSIRILPSSY